MLSYVREKSGWCCQYLKIKPDGTSFQTRKRGFPTKKDAKDWYDKYCSKVKAGVDIDAEKQTLSKWLDLWLDTYCCNIEKNTKASYMNNCDHIKKALGGQRLCDLRQTTVQGFYNKLIAKPEEGKPMSASMLAHVHTTFNQTMKKAYELGYINRNPCAGTNRPKVDPAKRLYCTSEQLTKILQLAKNTEYYLPIMLCAMLGLRRGEALGIKESAIKGDKVEICAQLAVDNLSGGVEYKEKPKTSKSVRTLTIPTVLLNEIKIARKTAKLDKLACGSVYLNEGFICTRLGGGYLSPGMFSKEVKKIMAAAGLDPKIHLHDLRHSYATLLRQAGMAIETISELLGHSDVKTTYKFYIGSDQDELERAADVISNIIRL